jgi:hypothetical protein
MFLIIAMYVALLQSFNISLKYLLGESEKARWFLIHSFINTIVAILTFSDTVIFFESLTPVNVEASLSASLIVMSLHLFHGICCRLNHMDIIHHVLMLIVLIIPLVNPTHDYIVFSNYLLFFICGLPGAIDYLLMYLVETNRIDQMTERWCNYRLNSYLRGPGILYGTFSLYHHWLQSSTAFLAHFIAIIICFWNATYFTHSVSYALGKAEGKMWGFGSLKKTK